MTSNRQLFPVGLRLIRTVLALIVAIGLLVPPLGPGTVEAQTASQKIDPALLVQMTSDATRMLPVIVEMAHARRPFLSRPNEQAAQRALTLLQTFGGQPVGGLAIISGAAGWANTTTIQALSLLSDVAYIHEDALIQPRQQTPERQPRFRPGQLSAPYPRVVNAERVWAQGTTGKGVTVAVLDSGIAADPDLTQPANRILAQVNFAGDLGGMPDRGGHGTHVAGTIAGNGFRSAGEFVGIAPEANLVDVRVLDGKGNGRLSSVIRGLEWVLAHRTQYNIRVVNLSLGAPAGRSYRLDPLTAAVEMAWKRGLVVVAASGNRGPNRGTVDTPGIDPYAVTVGATDDRESLPLVDDELAWFSSWGTPPDSTPKPDLVAPGRRIVSLRVSGSYLDTLFASRVVTARNGATYFRLSGTSMSTAVASGVAALLLERQPGLKPDQVKAVLIGTTQTYGRNGSPALPDPTADGSGLVDAYAAVNSPLRGSANQGLRPADAFARTLYPILFGQPLVWKDPNYQGSDWTNLAWDNLAWDNLAWDNLAWDNLAWDNLAWDNLAWDNLAWDNLAWDNLAWDRAGWDNLAWDSLTLD